MSKGLEDTAKVSDDKKDEEDPPHVSDRVPSIGKGRRWYDLPFRFADWLTRSWPRKFMNRKMRSAILKLINFLLVFYYYDRAKAEDVNSPFKNLVVPNGERVTQGGIWVVDFFPPSFFSSLYESLSKNGWDKKDPFIIHEGSNAERIERARRGRGLTWSRLGSVVDIDYKGFSIDAKRESMPDEFSMVELTAVQVGSSLTAVVAHFSLSKLGQSALGDVWCTKHEPRFKWRGFRRPTVEDRYFSGIHATQEERYRLHNVARKWLTVRCGGYFSETEAGQPVVDFSVFWKFDPLSEVSRHEAGDPLRSLGMDDNFMRSFVSPQMPGAVILPSVRESVSAPIRNCWGVIGAYDEVSRLNNRPGYGIWPYSVTTLAFLLDDSIREFALHVAVQRYVSELQATYARARDLARKRHSRYRARRLEQLRDEVLATSLDLPVVARDTSEFWDPRWKRIHELDVESIPGPGSKGRHHHKFDLLEEFGKARKDGFDDLLKEDAAYREVLSTVASLGASAEASKMGRRALIVSGASLVVALMAVLLANTGDDTVWANLVDWISGFIQ